MSKPGVPEIAEHELMEKLVHTYGKTWQHDSDRRSHRSRALSGIWQVEHPIDDPLDENYSQHLDGLSGSALTA